MDNQKKRPKNWLKNPRRNQIVLSQKELDRLVKSIRKDVDVYPSPGEEDYKGVN